MRITISKSWHHLHQKPSSHSEKQHTLSKHMQKNLRLGTQKKGEAKQHKVQVSEDNSCCEQGLFSRCLANTSSKKMEELHQIQIERYLHKAQFKQPTHCFNQELNSKLKVISHVSQQSPPIFFPKNLEMLKKVREQQHNARQLKVPLESTSNQETKKNTEVCISRQVSVLSTLTKQEVNKRQLVVEPCSFQQISVSQKKLKLTVMRRRQSDQFSRQAAQKKQVEGRSTGKKETESIILDKRQKMSKKNSYPFAQRNHQGSQSELKIIDPLDQFKSINTEYLKKKIAFSSVESERQQLHNHITQSIFYIKQKDGSSVMKKGAPKQDNFVQYFREVDMKSSMFSSSRSQINSQQSIVLENNFQTMFKFSVPSFSKIATSQETTNQNVFSSTSYGRSTKKQ